MKVWRLVSGILSIVLAVFVFFQSTIASVGEQLASASTNNGGAGMIVSILLLAGGIVSIVVNKSTSKGAAIAITIIFLLAGLIGVTNSSYYGDLLIWGIWCFVCGFFGFISIFKKAKE